MSRLRERYYDDVVPTLRKEFGYANVMAGTEGSSASSSNMGLGGGDPEFEADRRRARKSWRS